MRNSNKTVGVSKLFPGSGIARDGIATLMRTTTHPSHVTAFLTIQPFAH